MDGIDRTMPAVLRDYMALDDWHDFCDAVEATTRPLHWLRFLLLPAFASFALSIFFANFKLAIVAWVCFALTIVTIGCYSMCVSRELSKVCGQASTPDRSFHVRRGRRVSFIEISVNPNSRTPLNPQAAFEKNNAYENDFGESSSRSTPARLQHLEDIRHLISSQEYDQKRADILDTV